MSDFGIVPGATYAVGFSQYVRAGNGTTPTGDAIITPSNDCKNVIIIHMTKHAGSTFPFNRRSGSSLPCRLSGLLLRPTTSVLYVLIGHMSAGISGHSICIMFTNLMPSALPSSPFTRAAHRH